MKMNRRNVIVGLGTIVAGGGAALGTGAFSTVEAQRDVSVSVADDADGYLGIEVHDDRSGDEFVEEDGGTVEFDFDGNDHGADGLNDGAVTEFDNLITLSNNRDEEVSVDVVALDDGDEEVGAFTAYVGEQPDEVLEDETVGGTDEVHVGFAFDATGDNDPEQIEDIEISAE